MGRSWFGLRWVRIGGAALLLGLAAAAAVPFLVPADRFRPLLAHLLAADIQRDVSIGGLQLRLLPTVHIHADNVRIGNPPGFPVGDVIVLQAIDVGVAPLPLLSRKLDVTYVAVTGVRVNLLRDPAGRANYGFGASGPAGVFRLGRVRAMTLRNVTISFARTGPGGQITPVVAMSGVNARIRSIDPNAQDWAKGLEFVADLRGATLTAPALAAPVRFHTGEFRVGGGVGQGAFSASLDTTHATGTVKIPNFDPLSVTFAAAIPELDVDRIARVFAGGAGGPSGVRTVPAPPRLLVRGEVTIGRVRLAPLEATRMRARLSVYTTATRLDSYTLSAYGGTIQGAAVLSYSATDSPDVVSARLRGINLGRAVAVAAPRAQRMTDTLEADLRLTTTLGRDPRAALTGGGTFAVRDGSFPGMDLKGTMVRIANALQYHVPKGDTRFSYCGGDLRVAQQRVYSNDLRLHGDGLEGTARGSFGLNKTLDYVGTATVQAVASKTPPARGLFPAIGNLVGKAVRGVTGPAEVRAAFSVGGTFNEPKFVLIGSPGLHRQQRAQLRSSTPQASSQ